jgi:glycosyltransferase involved in cell wall biosynthesis
MDFLKIHFLTDSIAETGTYFRSHNLAVGLTKLGQQVTVFSCDLDPSSKDREEIRDGVLYRIVPSFRGQGIFSASNHPLNALRRCLIDYPSCDIAHLFQPFLSAALPWQWALPKKARVLFYDWDDLWEYGGLLKNPKNFHGYWNNSWILRIQNNFPQISHAVTTCSQFLKNLAEVRNAKRVYLIHNGFHSFSIPDKQLARGTLGLDMSALYVGFMGSTYGAEIDWCLEALERHIQDHKNLRFAICGRSPQILKGISQEVLERVDFLGILPYIKTRNFAAALDLGLLPLEDNLFNQSRLPIKYAEYMAASTPILCSNIGECGYLSENFPWVIRAGKNKSSWFAAFQEAINLAADNKLPEVDTTALGKMLSWESIAQKLLNTYFSELNRR